MILAIAGRRVDAKNAERARFPLANVDRVRQAMHATLVQQGATTVVSSAACGADLIALAEAGKLGICRRVVLPFGREKFRVTSVADRPGDWGVLYDEVLDQVQAAGELLIIGKLDHGDPYSVVSKLILDEAIKLGQERREAVGAAMVWDGAARGTPD